MLWVKNFSGSPTVTVVVLIVAEIAFVVFFQ